MKRKFAVLILLLFLVGCATTQESIHEVRSPRSELPKEISNDPVDHALSGWHYFGYMRKEGTKQEMLKSAAKRGAEAVALEKATIYRGRPYEETIGGRRSWVTPKEREGYSVYLFRRGEPNPQLALDAFCAPQWGNYGPPSYWSDTLKKILAAGGVDVNHRSQWGEHKGTTPLCRVVEKVLEETSVVKERRPYPGVIDNLLRNAALLMDHGADPSLSCGKALPRGLVTHVTEDIRASIKWEGDFSKNIKTYSSWRQLKWDMRMTPGHKQAALAELKDLLTR